MKNLLAGIAVSLGLLGATALPAAAQTVTYQNVYYYHTNGSVTHVETVQIQHPDVQVIDTGTYGYYPHYQHGYGFQYVPEPQTVVYVENQFLLPVATQYFGKPYHKHVAYHVGFP